MSNPNPFNIVSLDKFSLSSVLATLGIDESDKTAVAAVGFIKKIMIESYATDRTDRSAAQLMGNQHTIEKIQPLYDLYKKYKKDFFPNGYRPDFDAIVTAVICNEYTTSANEPVQDPDDPDNITTRDDGFDIDIIHRANRLYEEAVAFLAGELAPDDLDNGCDVSFLAHIYAFQEIDDFGENLDEYDREILVKLQERDIPLYFMMAATWNRMGSDLAAKVETFENHVMAALRTHPQPPTHNMTARPSHLDRKSVV